MTEHRGPQDLTLLIEQHQKDIWEWKQKESQWIRDKNQLDGNKKIIEELSSKMVEIGKANLALQQRAREAEGETTIVKGIGMNSPEMRAAQAKIKELESTLASVDSNSFILACAARISGEFIPIPLTIVVSPSASRALC